MAISAIASYSKLSIDYLLNCSIDEHLKYSEDFLNFIASKRKSNGGEGHYSEA